MQCNVIYECMYVIAVEGRKSWTNGIKNSEPTIQVAGTHPNWTFAQLATTSAVKDVELAVTHLAWNLGLSGLAA